MLRSSKAAYFPPLSSARGVRKFNTTDVPNALTQILNDIRPASLFLLSLRNKCSFLGAVDLLYGLVYDVEDTLDLAGRS